MRPGTVPASTYRLQFNRDFTCTYAAAIVAYLHASGASHVYASPYAAFFDIDWHPVKTGLRHKLPLPVLGDHCGSAGLMDGLRVDHIGGLSDPIRSSCH